MLGQDQGTSPLSRPGTQKAFAIVVVVLLVLVVGIATGIFTYKQVVYNATHQPQALMFNVKLSNYGTDDTPIPLHVVGTDIDGKHVDTEIYVKSDGSSTGLILGEYTATVDESPLTSDGRIYYGQGTEFSFKVIEEEHVAGRMVDGLTDDSEKTITMYEVEPIDIQTDWVTNAYNAAVKSGFDQATAAEYRDAALKSHEDAVSKKQLEANKLVQAEATEKAAQQTSDAEAKAIEGASWYAGDLGSDGITSVVRNGQDFEVTGKVKSAFSQESARLDTNTTEVAETSNKYPLSAAAYYFQISPTGTKSSVEIDAFYNSLTTKISGNSDQRLVWAVKDNKVVAVYLYEY